MAKRQEDHLNAFNQKGNTSYYYQAMDIRVIQSEIMRPYLQQFKIYELIGDTFSAKPVLKELLTSLDKAKPTLCVYNLGDWHWAVFAVIGTAGQITILYKDSKGSTNLNLKHQLMEFNSTIEFFANTEKEQIYGVDCGPFALDNMRIMAMELSKNKGKFIEDFVGFKKFCSLPRAKDLRQDEFAKQYVLGKYQEMIHEAIKAAKLQKLREHHSSETVEIAERLKGVEFFKDIDLRTVSAQEKLAEGITNTIAVEVATTSDTDPDRDDYSYQYRISFTKDLIARSLEIRSNVQTVFSDIAEFTERAVTLEASKIPIRHNTKVRVTDYDTGPIDITELFKNLNIDKNPNLQTAAQQVLDMFFNPLIKEHIPFDEASKIIQEYMGIGAIPVAEVIKPAIHQVSKGLVSAGSKTPPKITKKFDKLKFEEAISSINKEKNADQFKKGLKEVIGKLAKLQELDEPCKKYHKVLKDELAKQEKDPGYKLNEKLINRAKEELFFKTTPTVEELQKVTVAEKMMLKLEEEFKPECKKLSYVLDLIVLLKNDEITDKLLKVVSELLKIDYESFKAFFSLIKAKQQELNKSQSSPVEKNINELLAQIEKQKKSKKEEDGVKSIDKLIEELELPTEQEKAKLKADYDRVKEFSIKWQKERGQAIYDWAKAKKGKLSEEEIYEALAVMDRANELVTGGHCLRDTQIISVLAFLNGHEDGGRLCQINTGEGKTTITSLLATIKVLQGQKVDVITSNSVLAADAVKDKSSFYDLLNISVKTNNTEKDSKPNNGPKECYKADVVYGNITNFQFDYLTDSFNDYGTRNKREFDNVSIILDEVDNMLVDNGGHITKLSEPFPGMESLRYVYIKIWQELIKGEQFLTEQLTKDLQTQATKLEESGSSEEAAQELYNKFVREIKASWLNKIKEYIKKSDPLSIKLIPEHIKDYAASKLDTWIENALHAKYSYHENKHYVIKPVTKNEGSSDTSKEAVVIPVDYANTGMTMQNTVWSYALHQFVQLKHNLKLTAESLTSSYISNISYIKKYGKIYGLTGTLGSKAEQDLISSVYKVSYCKIPSYKPKKFVEEEGIVVSDDEWSNNVAMDAIKRAKSGRAVLIICQTIKDVNDVISNLKVLQEISAIKLRIKPFPDESYANITEETLKAGDIVVATNISGRGTDFKTDKAVEENGGLHVCIGFLPCNKRVEDQALGRTSRQGNEGTGQLIIRESEVEQFKSKLKDEEYGFHLIKKERDEAEKVRLKETEQSSIPELLIKDELFDYFARLYKGLKNTKAKADEGYYYVLKDLKEFWAFWLEKQDLSNVKKYGVERVFREFESAAVKIIEGNIIHNPYYGIGLAEMYLQNENIDKAKEALHNVIAISKNPEILYSAYLKLFEVAMEEGGGVMQRFKDAMAKVVIFGYFKNVKNEKYKDEAIEYLTKAKKALTEEIEYIDINFFRESSKEFQEIITTDPGKENLFLKHLGSRLQALNIYNHTINSLLEGVKESGEKGLTISSRIPDYLIKLEPKTDNEKQIKKAVGNTELIELQQIGLDTIYGLREVHDVSKEVIAGAQVQIAGGITLLVSGAAFPPAALVTTPLAWTMISEGICDVAMELIAKGEEGFNWKAYAKGKAISYGISFLTMGVGALATCQKMISKAIKACKDLSDILRKSTFMKGLCEKLANNIDKIGKWLEKVKEVNKIAKLSKAKQLDELEKLSKAGKLEKLGLTEKLIELQKLKELGKLQDLSKFQTFATSLTSITTNSMKNMALSIAMEKVVTAGLQEIMQGLKPQIKEKVKEELEKEIGKEKLKSAKNFQEAIREVNEGTITEMLEQIAEEIALGLVKQSSGWRMKLVSLSVDTAASVNKIRNYVKSFCQKLNEKLITDDSNHDVDVIIEQLVEQMTATIYSMIIDLTGQIGVALPGVIKGVAGDLKEKYKKKKEKLDRLEKDEIAKSEKDVAEQQQHEAERIKAGKEPKKCVDLTLDSLDPAGRSEDGLGPKTQSKVRELIENRLAKAGSKAYEENLGTLNRKEILNALKKHGSSEGMLLLSREDGSIGHAVKVKKVGSKLILVDSQSGKVMDHQQAKAYFSEHNYSKAAVMGAQPAGFKEGIGKKSVRKVKEFTGIDAGPGKPFDKDVEFAGRKRQQAEDLPPKPSKQKRITMDNPDSQKDKLFKDALDQHYKENCKDFENLLHLSAQLKSKYPDIIFNIEKAACLQHGKGFTTKGKELSGNLLEQPLAFFKDVHAAHTIGFGLIIKNDHYVNPEDKKHLLAIYHLTQKTNLLPGFINNNGDFDKGKDRTAYDTFSAFIKEGAKLPDYFYMSYLHDMLNHTGKFKEWKLKHYNGPNSISAAFLRDKGLKGAMQKVCYEAVHDQYEAAHKEYDNLELAGDQVGS